MRPRSILLVLLVVFGLCGRLFGATYYVATDGDDGTGDGSIGTPWKTIAYGESQCNDGDILNVRGGTYREQVTLSDSGSEGSPITIQGYAAETAIVSGLTELTSGWAACVSAADAGGSASWSHIYKCTPGYTVTQLFQNSVRLRPSRWPDAEGSYSFPTTAGDTTHFHDTALTQAEDYWNGATCHVFLSAYKLSHKVVSDYETAGDVVTIAAADTSILTTMGYYFTNLPGEINAEGEWAYNGTTLYLWPVGGSLSGIEASGSIDYAFYSNGRAYYVIDNLTMTGQDYGAVFLNDTDNCTISDNTIQYSLVAGVTVSLGTPDGNIISGNTITGCGAIGINIGALATNTTVTANTITGVGTDHFGGDMPYSTYDWNGQGISGGGAGGLYTYNRIDGIGGHGIVVASAAGGLNTVSWNYITNYLLGMSDGGGIYNAAENATVDTISYNIVGGGYGFGGGVSTLYATRSVPVNAHGLYSDEHALNDEWTYNTVFHVSGSGMNNNQNNTQTITGNTFYGFGISGLYFNHNGDHHIVGFAISGNTIVALDSAAETITFNDITDTAPSTTTCNTNYLFNADTEANLQYYEAGVQHATLAQWRTKFGYDAASYAYPSFCGSLTRYADTDTILLLNPTNASADIAIPAGSWRDVDGLVYTGGGTASIGAYQSLVLVRDFTGVLLQ